MWQELLASFRSKAELPPIISTPYDFDNVMQHASSSCRSRSPISRTEDLVMASKGVAASDGEEALVRVEGGEDQVARLLAEVLDGDAPSTLAADNVVLSSISSC